tara:strand:+ start:265 stop:810 length:546 start_codon:yes stop_codon:yes gene_type:complete
MNIFAVHRNPVIAARSLCDSHISKMTLETAQMLASACIRHGVEPEDLPKTKAGQPYKAAHPHHPSTVWCGDTRDNFEWLCWHGLALGIEFEKHYKKSHASVEAIKQACSVIDQIPVGTQTPFARAINKDIYPQLNDPIEWPNTVLAYRAFYMLDKKDFAKWGGDRTPPAWWNPNFTMEMNI